MPSIAASDSDACRVETLNAMSCGPRRPRVGCQVQMASPMNSAPWAGNW